MSPTSYQAAPPRIKTRSRTKAPWLRTSSRPGNLLERALNIAHALEETPQRLHDLTSNTRLLKEHDGGALTFHRVGSMFCLFFREGEVTDLDSAMAADKESFGKFFHACLDRGVYLAPSPYENGFLCLAHAADDIGRTVEVIGEALAIC